jgi:hypothetical protein
MDASLLDRIARAMAVLMVAMGCVTAVSSSRAAEAVPTKLVVFDFILEDGSAGASIAADGDGDDASMKAVNAEVQRTIERSGRYELIDASEAEAQAARECDDCKAQVAAALGAEQFLTGVVRRITRTEYVVGFQLRDARTGNILAHRESDLRMGANYSWSRGAASLMKTYLLD